MTTVNERSDKLPTVQESAQLALDYWHGRPGGTVMASRLSTCLRLLGLPQGMLLKDVSAATGTTLLTKLREKGLAKASVVAYYTAFKRMCALSGLNVALWPNAPQPPRKGSREPMKEDDLERLTKWLRLAGYGPTADLAVLLRGAGLRISVEGLTEAHLAYTPPTGAAADVEAASYGVLRITGKGEHERTIPVVDEACQALLVDAGRLDQVRRVSYQCHLRYWRKGVTYLGIATKLPTPHSVRHLYATDAFERSGGDLALVQELLGHSDPATTIRYLGIKLDNKARALRRA